MVRPRSALKVDWAACQPALGSPIRLAAGMRTSLRKISQKCPSPMAFLIGLTSTPGERMSIRK